MPHEPIPKVHWRDLRLFVNAGVAFPVCHISKKKQPLDMDKSALVTSPDKDKVTCQRCLKRMAEAS